MLSGSMTTAARELHTSQPNVSRIIAQLEKSTSLRLFDRVGGRLIPTEQGTAFFHEVERAFVGLKSLAATADRIRHLSAGSLRIAGIPTLALGFLPRVVKRFRASYPHIAFSIHTGSSQTVAQWTASQYCDLGVAMHGHAISGTEAEFLYELEGVCVLPKGHRLASKKVIRAVDLRKEQFISFTHEAVTRSMIHKVLEDADVHPLTTLDSPYSSIVCSLVALGLGVAIVTPLVARDFMHAGIVIRPFESSIPYAADVLFPRYRPRSALARRFVDAMRAQLAEELDISSA